VSPDLSRRNRGCENACYRAIEENEFSPVHSVIGFAHFNGRDILAFARCFPALYLCLRYDSRWAASTRRRLDAVNVTLLNEFLKEHRKVEQQDHKIQEQDATIAQLKSEMKGLTATLKEQAAQIQKVSAQLEVSKPAPQTVLNTQ
jgi:septal ring factor EnvC (AmiA/AmiB activator)